MGKDNIVLLHGWGGSKNSLSKLANELKDKFNVLNVELPGFGETPEPESIWGVKDYSNYVVEQVNKMDIKNFHLFGHSFGGQIAVQVTLDYPIKLKKLILCGAAIVRKRGSLTQLKIKTAKFLKNTPLFPILSLLMRNSAYQKASPKMKKVMNQILQEDLTNQLDQIKVPTLILWGEKDSITPLSRGELIHQKIKNSKLVVFKNERHSLPLTSFPKVARKIKELI